MKKIITLATLGLLVAAYPISAQTVYDAAKIADKDLNGTARFVGMGGAMGALGGDISTIGTNPAGIGIYRSNDVMTSFGLSSYGASSDYMGKKIDHNNIRGSFDNIGFVFASKFGNETPLRYVNFGFNYHKAKSFYKNMSMEGNLGNYSQTYQMASQADGINDWGKTPFNDANIGWLSAIGYFGALISPEITTNKTDFPYLNSKGEQIYEPVNPDKPDEPRKPLYLNPEYYKSIAPRGISPFAKFRSEERGGIDQYDFNVSFNVNDRVYLGMTVGVYSVNYSKYTYYSEDYGDKTGYDLQSWNKINGSGFDVKFGAIVRPFENSPFRIGLAIHTPTFYSLEYKTSVYLQSDVYNLETDKIDLLKVDTREKLPDGGDMVRPFNLQTPWTYNFSLGYTVGKNLALGAEYEYKDYSSMKFRDPEGYSEIFDFENSTTPMLKGVNTFRIGAEYKVIPQFALRLGYNYNSAAFQSDAFKDLPYYSIQTDTDFANSQSNNHYTLGIGYRGSMFYADLAYKYSTYKEEFYPFINTYQEDGKMVFATPEATKVTNTRSQVLLTLGLRF